MLAVCSHGYELLYPSTETSEGVRVTRRDKPGKVKKFVFSS